jgi:anti-sigma factor RsiW
MNAGHRHGGAECRKLLEQLSEYIDGELDPAGCAAIESHTEDCATCRAFIESLRRTVDLIHRLPRPTISEETRRELVAAWERFRSESGSS